MFWVILALFLSAPTTAESLDENDAQLKVCGQFCGPSWCGGKATPENTCVATGAWNVPSDSSCADNCCKTHDYCCGSGADRPSCNKAIVNCITASNCYLSLCGAAVWAALKAVSNWCCGSPCPTSLIDEVEARLNITGQLADAIARVSAV